jgi:putative toxin-antitoxin system antitoxin component (TIGR02293 family)
LNNNHGFMSSAAASLPSLPRDEAELISLVREGLPAASLLPLRETMGLTQEGLARLVQVPASTLRRKLRQGERLEPGPSERIVELQQLCAYGEAVLGGGEALREWLHQPVLALGRETPLALLDTHLGTSWVRASLGRIEHGVFA